MYRPSSLGSLSQSRRSVNNDDKLRFRNQTPGVSRRSTRVAPMGASQSLPDANRRSSLHNSSYPRGLAPSCWDGSRVDHGAGKRQRSLAQESRAGSKMQREIFATVFLPTESERFESLVHATSWTWRKGCGRHDDFPYDKLRTRLASQGERE